MVDTIDFGTFKWHHITNPTVEDLDFLRDNFHFHPLDIEDCSSFVQRPKIDIYDDYFFLVLHFPLVDKRTQLVRTEEGWQLALCGARPFQLHQDSSRA